MVWSSGVDYDFFAIRVTESFLRDIMHETFTVEHGHVVKLFEVEPELSTIDFPLVGAFGDDGKWCHLGAVSLRLRVAANSDSFDQLRANVIKAKENSRKTNLPRLSPGLLHSHPGLFFSTEYIAYNCSGPRKGNQHLEKNWQECVQTGERREFHLACGVSMKVDLNRDCLAFSEGLILVGPPEHGAFHFGWWDTRAKAVTEGTLELCVVLADPRQVLHEFVEAFVGSLNHVKAGRFSAEVGIAEKAQKQYHRVLEVVELARKKRVDLEERLANLHRDKSLSETQMRVAVSAIEEETCSLLRELLGNEDLSSTIPPCSGSDNSSGSYVSFSQLLRQLVEQSALSMQ
ncbi:unnamed protein product [Hydatigera taeniaeformis]|uniref:SAWADEE domain-containing protein n=1 Tax=Hydatigena taeniaeformis TaxID=6205 RepID=A0A158REB7_HYDTA|nr:unnamed protein product [Hydatigera taeniaeformis]